MIVFLNDNIIFMLSNTNVYYKAVLEIKMKKK